MKTGIGDLRRRNLYQDLLRRLDGRAILERYGAQNCREQPGAEGTTEIVHSCLIDRVEPHHTNGDAHPSAAMNVEKKTYVCYSLGSGFDLIHLLAKLRDQEVVNVLPELGEFLTGSTKDAGDCWAEIRELMSGPVLAAADVELPRYSPRILGDWGYTHPYLIEERGISHATARDWQIGFDERTHRITFPHFWRGHLVGWQKRSIPARPGRWPGTPDPWPKYLSSTGFPKSTTLYGYDRLSRPERVVVVESPMSTIKAASLGVSGVLATFGAKVSEHQLDLLSKFPRVTVWFDDDGAGRIGEHRLVEGLYRRTTVDVITPDEGRDLGDCGTIDELQQKLASAAPAILIMAGYPQPSERH